MQDTRKVTKGRGAGTNPDNRFEKTHFEFDPGDWAADPDGETTLLRTEFIRDFSKSIVTENKSPDIPFRFSVNPYRGCEHGCAYCYARPSHEFLGYSAGLDFESKILVKEDAPRLLRERLMQPSWVPETITMSGITDCYQPAERKYQLTRGCLQVLADFKNPVSIITKNHLVVRDRDILASLAEVNAAFVFLSVTTLDADLGAVLEPRTSRPSARLEAIRLLSEAGIPVGVNIAPVIPGLNDHEIPAILKAAAQAGATIAGYTPLRLPLTVLPVFEDWLDRNRPDRKPKILELVRSLRGGKLNDANFGSRMRGEGAVAANLEQMFRIYSRREGLNQKRIELSTAHFTRPGDQLSFF